MNEERMRKLVHEAIMRGFEEDGVQYESDGETYWIDFDGGTLYVGIGRCEDKED